MNLNRSYNQGHFILAVLMASLLAALLYLLDGKVAIQYALIFGVPELEPFNFEFVGSIAAPSQVQLDATRFGTPCPALPRSGTDSSM